jgi:uncharacterized protein
MSYAHSARTVFADMLGTLDHLVAKAQEAGLSDDVLAVRLVEDMFPLEMQFRVGLNQVLLSLNQVAGRKVPLEESAYRTLAEVRERIGAVRAQVDQAELDGWAEPASTVDLTLPNGARFVMSSEEDMRDWIMPNFYFHVTMAYALLRKAGLAVGKADYLSHMRRYIAPST